MLISSDELVRKITEQRRLYLLQTLVFTLLLFSSPHIISHAVVLDYTYGISGIVLAWSCGLAAIGYAKRYLNIDSKYRKIANEGIYPFYLLHQPIIIVLGYYFTNWEVHLVIKFISFTLVSFLISVAIYWLLIRPFNFMRILFGLKVVKSQKIKGPELVPLQE